jgi:hypothetical protein
MVWHFLCVPVTARMPKLMDQIFQVDRGRGGLSRVHSPTWRNHRRVTCCRLDAILSETWPGSSISYLQSLHPPLSGGFWQNECRCDPRLSLSQGGEIRPSLSGLHGARVSSPPSSPRLCEDNVCAHDGGLESTLFLATRNEVLVMRVPGSPGGQCKYL